MESPFLDSDIKLSALVKGKQIEKIRHTDKDCCIEIKFSDGSYFILDGILCAACNNGTAPLLAYYDSSDNPVVYNL